MVRPGRDICDPVYDRATPLQQCRVYILGSDPFAVCDDPLPAKRGQLGIFGLGTILTARLSGTEGF